MEHPKDKAKTTSLEKKGKKEEDKGEKPKEIKVLEIIEKLNINPEEKKNLIAHFVMTHFEGPLPPSSEFAGYENTLPGAGDRIIKMTETLTDAQARRMDARTKVHVRQNTFAFIIVMGILGITFYSIARGFKEGLWLVLAELVTMLGIFLGNKFKKK